MSNTLIEKINEEKKICIDVDSFIFDSDNLSKHILDLSLQENIRIHALELYYKQNKDDTIELISRITGMYQFSGTKILQNFLKYICISEIELSAFLKLECAKSLLSFYEFEEDIFKDDDEEMVDIKTDSNTQIKIRNSQRKELGYKALDNVCKYLFEENDFPTPCKIDAICMLMEIDNYKENCNEYFGLVINDNNIECDYRYKAILSLEKRNILNNKYYIKEACFNFLNNAGNRTLYRILSAQYLLQHCEIEDEIQNLLIQSFLLTFSEDDELDYNLRADAADTLLTLGNNEYKIKAQNIIRILGRMGKNVVSLFDNAQNVHTKEIEESVKDVLQFLISVPTILVEENNIDFSYISTQINNILKDEIISIENKDQTGDFKCDNCLTKINNEGFCGDVCEKINEKHNKIKLSLNRIEMDRTLYSSFNSNLSLITIKLWSYIQQHEFKDTMITRLIEELEDMSGTCSSGFLSRLINTISGFGDFALRISFTDQIISNFVGRLNYYARKITDEDSPFRTDLLYDVVELYVYKKDIHLKYPEAISMKKLIDEYLSVNRYEKVNNILEDFEEEVINEMMLETVKFNERRHFLMFFRQYMLRIREELYEEFKQYVSDTDFDLTIRKAISAYEGVVL